MASQEGVSDFLKALIGGALLGLVAGLSITGVFAIVMVGIFAQLITLLAITTIFIGMGLVLSEMWTVKIGIEISIGGEMKYLADIGVLLSPDGGISISHSLFGGGIGTSDFDLSPEISPYIDIYPGYVTSEDVNNLDFVSSVGGSVPVGAGSVGGDLLFDTNEGLVGFSINSSFGYSTPEFHWEGGT